MNDFLEFILLVAAYIGIWCWWSKRCEDKERAQRLEDQERARRREDEKPARRHEDMDYTKPLSPEDLEISLDDF